MNKNKYNSLRNEIYNKKDIKPQANIENKNECNSVKIDIENKDWSDLNFN